MSVKLPPFTQQDCEIIEREVLYRGIFCLARYHVRFRLFNGGWSDIIQREVLERLSASAVLPYDPILDQVILIEQFRPGTLTHQTSPWLTEIVAGVIEKDQAPEEVARREAVEEANCNISDLHPICEYFPSPGGSNEYLHLYCARIDASQIGGVHGLKNENEDIRAYAISAEEAFKKLEDGLIKTTPAIISLQWLQLNKEKLRNLWLKK
jgi:ADP-ribose pyrophosphatase